jgi:hypothetical protein
MHVPAEPCKTLLLSLKEGVIITPGVRIGRGADHVHVDGPMPCHKRLLHGFEAADQELCLSTDAIGEIIEPIIREIKYGIAHRAHGSMGICRAFGGITGYAVGGNGMSVILDTE